ncbi:MAG: hypothetical protein RLZ12_925 [Bacillota bacterium]
MTLKLNALDYHELPTPGKLSINLTKAMETEQDLLLAYTPGVAEPVRSIANNPADVYKYTAKGNLVAVITNGSAILGLGNLGPLASKPVMEGKAALFKRCAGVDAFDIEIDAPTTASFIETVANISPTFGGINLEDIKSPDCFIIERELTERLPIPVFHDDQHGTAVVVAAALLNALELQNKTLTNIQTVCLGAGAAAIATMRLLVALGLPREAITMVDRQGIIHNRRQGLNSYKAEFATNTDMRTLKEAIKGADLFIGLSGPNLLTAELLRTMNERAILFALSNPEPEIDPELVHALRPDIIVATGRNDYPNQVNNVLCFPYLFRGALDARACQITQTMLIAATEALRTLVHQNDELALKFGPTYILPKPFDPRLLKKIPQAVASAAKETGAARP